MVTEECIFGPHQDFEDSAFAYGDCSATDGRGGKSRRAEMTRHDDADKHFHSKARLTSLPARDSTTRELVENRRREILLCENTVLRYLKID